MMSSYLENLLSNTQAAVVTELFIWVLLGIFVFSIFCLVICKGSKFTAYTPNLLTSIGILGTFVGIVIGLMAFDPKDIDNSISLLLDGLKTAFITSLVGMGSSIVYKMLSTTPFLNRNSAGANGKDVGPQLVASLQRQNEQLEDLRKAIVGDEESSIAGQLKLFRGDARDRGDETKKHLTHSAKSLETIVDVAEKQQNVFEQFSAELWKQLETFAEMLSKSATEQVINALKEVISDFNEKLTEQFGENFKALDASVKKLVEWQDNYRVQLEQMGEQYEQGVQAITQTEASITHISEESKSIPVAMGELRQVLEINQHQIDELDRHLDAFVQVKDKAVEAVPVIRQQIETMTSGVADSTKMLTEGLVSSGEKMQSTIAIGIEEFENNVQRLSGNLTSTSDTLTEQTENIRDQLQDTVKDLNDNNRNMVETMVNGAKELADDTSTMNKLIKKAGQQIQQDTAEVQQQVASSIDQMQRRLESTMEEVFQAQTREMNRALDGVTSAVKTAVERTGDGVNTQISMIDEAMQKEIERVMNEMGQALARITNQFTQDYSKLVNAMQKVVKQGTVSS